MDNPAHKQAIENFQSEIATCRMKLEEALTDINQENIPNVMGLDATISDICSRIEKSPPVVAHALKYELKEMLSLAEELVMSVENLRDTLVKRAETSH